MTRKMSSFTLILLIFYVATTSGLPPSISKQYRADYVYNKRTDAFYKLHIESRKVWVAEEVCAFEGGALMVPATQRDVMQLHMMYKRYPDLGDYVLVGNDGQKHESAEEQPLINFDDSDEDLKTIKSVCDVVTRKGDIESISCLRSLPFICKVEAKDAPYNKECNVFGKDYQYNATVGSCYMISKIAMNWNQAYSECQLEGSHLVVINSELEQKAVWDLMKKMPRVANAKAHWFYFAGFRAKKTDHGVPRVFKTVLNQTLDEAGYNQWSEHEPNNFLNYEYCGSIFKNDGKFNDLSCAQNYAFICEKEVHT